MSEVGPKFLKEKYSLQNAPEVKTARRAYESRVGLGEKIGDAPAEQIQNYLDRLSEVFAHEEIKTHKGREGREVMRDFLHHRFVIKAKDIPESVFLLEQRLARELGHGDVEITDEFKEKKTAEIISSQHQSLDKWIDYLTSPDAEYPDWAKYWALRSVLEMGKIKKEETEDGKEVLKFLKRAKDTAAQFPPMNPRALAVAIEAVRLIREEKEKLKGKRQPIKNLSTKLDDESFQKLVATESFPKIYAQFLLEMPEYSTEGLQEIRGKWVKYEQGSDASDLVHSLEGYPLEWCTAAFDTAQTQLQGGDFYTYYSIDQNGDAKIPRAAIRMEQSRIAEVRGIAHNQNLDPYISPVVQEKMNEFPDGKAYEKKAADMKKLTALEEKMRAKKPFTKNDLKFLYELNAPIEGFGYEKDPRIAELREGRDANADALIVFDCSEDEIAHDLENINPDTKAYIGKLEPGIFQKLPDTIEHIYTSFPEGKIRRERKIIGGKTKDELEDMVRESGAEIDSWAQALAESKDFKTLSTPEEVQLIRLDVAALGFPNGATTDQIFKRAFELGLDYCPPETGHFYRARYTNQPMYEYIAVGMKPIVGSDGNPSVFNVLRNSAAPGLDASNADPERKWYADDHFLFRLRKLDPEKLSPEPDKETILQKLKNIIPW